MESLNPTLRLIMCLREGLEKGESTRQSLQSFITANECDLSRQLKSWWIRHETGAASTLPEKFTLSQRATLNLLKRSLQGESIGAGLLLLQQEVIEKCESQIEEHVQSLPLKALLPLLFFIFPSYLLILLGPLVEELIRSINH